MVVGIAKDKEDYMDFADKKAVKYFLKDNGIEDLTQLKLVFKSMAGSLLDELLEGERDVRQT